MDDKLLSKIEKLINLGNGSSYEGEASIALKRAYDLMRQHGVSMEDVMAHSKDEVLGLLGSENLEEKRKQYRKWEINLCVNICKLFDCKALHSGLRTWWDKKGTLVIVGREGNRTTAKLMYQWIHDKTLKEARQIGDCSSSRNAYCTGIVDSLSNKIRAIKAGESNVDQWGLVPVSEVENWINLQFGKLDDYSMNGATIKDSMAYYGGRREGDKISLNRQFATTGIGYNG